MGESSTSEKRISATEKSRQALELRKGGAGFQQIADALGYRSVSSAYDAVHRALDKVIREPAEGVIEMELGRLDAMWLALWPKIRAGDVQAVDRGLRIMERRAKYLGLDAPKRIDITARVREFARENGIDEDEAVREAQDVIARAQQ